MNKNSVDDLYTCTQEIALHFKDMYINGIYTPNKPGHHIISHLY